MHMSHFRVRQSGFSLLEVLIALVLFAVALIGFASAAAISMRSGKTATSRTQSIVLAQYLENRMRVNIRGVNAGNYAGTFSLATGAPANNCSSGCSPAELADYDLRSWGQGIGRALPAGSGSVVCNLEPPAVARGMEPTPRGLCTISITWSEQADEGMRGGDTGARVGRFDWVFNP